MSRQEHKHWGLLIIILLTSVLCIANYTPGTILSGWDTLHPEFNFPLAFTRAFFGVFRAEQGVGAVAAHAHMADLPHIFLLWIFSFLLPQNLLRYTYMFLCLFAGPIGMYFFLGRILKNKIAILLGSVFYLLNLGTLQQFFVPFEMFTTQYALLPWLFLFGFDYLFLGKKQTLLFLAIVIIFLSPTAFASVLWYLQLFVFFLILGTATFLYGERKRPLYLPRLGHMFAIFLGLNAFWLLPNFYFLATHAKDVTTAFTNQLFSEEAFLYNKAFGNPLDILQMKTFYFAWSIYKGNSAFEPLLTLWKSFGDNVLIHSLWLLVSLPSLVGIVWVAWKKQKLLLSFFPGFGIVLFFLINDNLPTGFLYSLFQKIPLFQEALRFPDDKVLGLFTFFVAVFFAAGCSLALQKVIRQKLFATTIISILMLTMLPAFTGHLISPNMRIDLPRSYLNMFDWFNNQEDGRVAIFPIHSPWGWEYYNWYNDTKPSFQGSGFLTFGIKQPILDRDFDRWNPLNESYYREMSYAIYSNNPDLFQKVLQKYNIRYILLDKSIIAPDQSTDVLSFDRIEHFLDTAHLTYKTSFSKTLNVYTVQNDSKKSDVAYGSNLPSVLQTDKYYYSDSIYQQLGAYQEVPKETPTTVVFPFHGLINHLSGVDAKDTYQGISLVQPLTDMKNFPISSNDLGGIIWATITLKQNGDNFSLLLTPLLPIANTSVKPIEVTLPSINGKSVYIVVNKKDVFQVVPSQSTDTIPLGQIQLFTNKDNTIGMYQPTTELTGLPLSQKAMTAAPCSQITGKEIFGINNITKNSFTLFAKQTNLCMTIPLKNIVPAGAPDDFLLRGNYTYQGSNPSSFCIADKEKGQCLQNKFTDISADKSDTTSHFAFALKSDDISADILKLAVDTTSDSFFVSSTYNNLEFFIEKPIDEETVSGSDVLSHIPQSVVATNTIEATVGKSDNTLTTLLPSQPNQANDCLQNPLTYKLTQNLIKKVNTASYSRYIATDGSYCDHISYPHITHDQGYLLAITARSISGLTPRICVSDPASGRCNLYTKLEKSDAFTTQYFLIPPFHDNNEGYDVNINNVGIPGTESVNDIASVELTPLSYEWLTSLHSTEDAAQQHTLTNLPSVSALNKNVVFIPSVPPSATTLTLDESFETGWKLYAIPNYIPLSFASSFPFLLPQITTHTRVNGWANGWDIKTSPHTAYLIVYFPAYFEYIGLGLFVATILALLYPILASRFDRIRPI